VAADRLQHVIGDAHFGKLSDDRVPQIMKPQAVQAGGRAQCSPGRVPVQLRDGESAFLEGPTFVRAEING
jgi:hypothetical protein